MSDDFDNGFYEEKRPRDHVVDAAKQVLLDRHFPRDGTQVYYGRQLEVWLERTFFHWITKKALNELVAEHRINFTPETTEHYTAHFYWPLRHRYPRRQIAEILGLKDRIRFMPSTRMALARPTRPNSVGSKKVQCSRRASAFLR